MPEPVPIIGAWVMVGRVGAWGPLSARVRALLTVGNDIYRKALTEHACCIRAGISTSRFGMQQIYQRCHNDTKLHLALFLTNQLCVFVTNSYNSLERDLWHTVHAFTAKLFYITVYDIDVTRMCIYSRWGNISKNQERARLVVPNARHQRRAQSPRVVA